LTEYEAGVYQAMLLARFLIYRDQ